MLEGVPRYTDLTPGSTVSAVWRGMAKVTHPPLYFVLANIWRRWLGDSEATVRSLSAIFSLLSIAILAATMRFARWYRLALVAALFLAFSSADVYAAQQARPYAPAMFFVVTATVLLISLERPARENRRTARFGIPLVYALCLLGAMLTHYFSALPLLGHVIYAGIRFRGALLVRWGIAVVAAVFGWVLLWGPTFLDQLTAKSNQPWLSETTSDHLRRTVMRATDLPMRLLYVYEPFTFSTSRSIAGGGLLIALAWLLRPSHRGDQPPGLAGLAGLLFAVPVVVFAAIDLLGERQLLAYPRYCTFAWPGLLGVLVVALDRLSDRRQLIASCVFLLGVAMTLRLPAVDGPDVRAAVDVITETSRPGDLLVFDAIDWPKDWGSRMHAEISYYLPDAARPFAMLRDVPGGAFLSQMRSFDRLIVVCPRPNGVSSLMPEVFSVTHRLTDYMDQVGWIYLLERSE